MDKEVFVIAAQLHISTKQAEGVLIGRAREALAYRKAFKAGFLAALKGQPLTRATYETQGRDALIAYLNGAHFAVELFPSTVVTIA